MTTLGACVEPRQLDTCDLIGWRSDRPANSVQTGFAGGKLSRGSLDIIKFIGSRSDGLPIAARLYLTKSAKRKRRKPPRQRGFAS